MKKHYNRFRSLAPYIKKALKMGLFLISGSHLVVVSAASFEISGELDMMVAALSRYFPIASTSLFLGGCEIFSFPLTPFLFP